MHKRTSLAAVVVGILTLSFGNLCAAQNAPQIVAKNRFLNQSGPIATTTIYTPPVVGLFRLSVYGTIIMPDPGSLGGWTYLLQWTDDSGVTTTNDPLYSIGSTAGPFGNFIGSWGGDIVIEVKAGTPINFSVSQSGPSTTSTYSLYYTLERL